MGLGSLAHMGCEVSFLQSWPIKSSSLITSLLAVVEDADYLLIAKPVAVNHLGIRRDYALGLVSCAGY